MLASSAYDLKLHLWETYECVGSVSAADPNSQGFLDFAWCNEGRSLAVVPEIGKGFVVSLCESKGPAQKWRQDIIDYHGVRTLSFSRTDAPSLVVGTETGDVMIYNTGRKKVLFSFTSVPSPVDFIEYGAHDAYIAAGCNNAKIYVYGPNSPEAATSLTVPGNYLSAFAVHHNQVNTLAGGSDRGIVTVWDTNSGQNIMKTRSHMEPVQDIAFSISDTCFTTIGRDQKINIYDLRTCERVHDKQFDIELTAMTYCPNGNDIAVATGNGHIICLDRRYLHVAKSSLHAHEEPIKKISYDSSNIKLESACSSEAYPSDITPDVSRNLPGGDCKGQNVQEVEEVVIEKPPAYHIVDHGCLDSLKQEIKDIMASALYDVTESMNHEFLRLRMGISRQFCLMELKSKKSWQDFNMILMKIGNEDGPRTDQQCIEDLEDIEEDDVISNKSDTSLQSPAKSMK